MEDLVTSLLAVLQSPTDQGFNVFNVMHHGTHEKQISNVFRWLLEPEGTHHLGDMFLRIFIDEINESLAGGAAFAPAPFLVLQEVNTAETGGVQDIADLVLSNDEATIVVENYFTSDGHGHSYDGYLRYSRRGGRQGAVVLLCGDRDSSVQTDGWEDAPVLTYGRLIDRLHTALEGDKQYRRQHPEAYAFIGQMHRKFVKGRGRVEDHQLLGFVTAMCTTGEARRYGERLHSSAAENFANDVAEQARERFEEGRELLQRVKGRMRNFSAEVLSKQLNATLGDGAVGKVSATYAGIYQWTINFDFPDNLATFGEAGLALKFGPSAWWANEHDPRWTRTVDPGVADYSHLFVTLAKTTQVQQSDVTLREVLDGLAPTDRRLHDEIVQMIRPIG